MAETHGVSVPAAVFRTGWGKRGQDTIWECSSDSFVLSKEAGKAVSGWMTKIGNPIVSGQPPSFDDIEGNRQELLQFTDTLCEDDTSKRWNPKVRELLVMTLLLRCDQFCEVSRSHPEATTEATVAIPEEAKVSGVSVTHWHHSFDCSPV